MLVSGLNESSHRPSEGLDAAEEGGGRGGRGWWWGSVCFVLQAEEGVRGGVVCGGLGDVYKRVV